ncbi:alpha/beta hydrolase [Dictyobacter sp. S3.2.2.5]|uniref:Alpha/beta hydrolase n=1 Tax=Dictyobacter halimunensis TaxID=3026934 RepID=A0ABQ6FKQ5_9CHLR|nr:alpha/beta hydrolase [Dictyobacter sp. S3.2.2.5]
MRKIASKDGTAIAFDQSGEGPAVILVGGAFQHRAIDPKAARLAALLAQHFTVFHYDRRGRGESGDTLPYATLREIEDLEALIKEAGGLACVFGMSSGAVLTLHAAARGLAIKKMALYEAPFNAGDDDSRHASENYTKQLTALLAESHWGDAVALAMTTFGAPAQAVAGMRQMPFWSTFEAVAPTLAYDNAIMGDGSVPTTLISSISVPALVLDGEASPALMHKAADAVAHSLPNAQRCTLAGQTHEVDPDVLAPVLVEFFAG